MDAVGRQQPLERGPVIALRIGLAVGMAGDDLRSIVRCVGRRADRPVLLDRALNGSSARANHSIFRAEDTTNRPKSAISCAPVNERFYSIPSATGAIARLACARLRELGKDLTAVIAKVRAKSEQVYDDAIRLEVRKQIRILELASEELQDGLLGFHLARGFDLREIGLVYYVIASSERFADALLNAKRFALS